jgi:hypothetical protein
VVGEEAAMTSELKFGDIRHEEHCHDKSNKVRKKTATSCIACWVHEEKGARVQRRPDEVEVDMVLVRMNGAEGLAN